MLTNNIVASWFFAHTPSKIRWIVKICDVVDLFLQKRFWFFLSMFSILGSMRLRSMALYILATIYVSSIPQLLLANPKSPFLGKGRIGRSSKIIKRNDTHRATIVSLIISTLFANFTFLTNTHLITHNFGVRFLCKLHIEGKSRDVVADVPGLITFYIGNHSTPFEKKIRMNNHWMYVVDSISSQPFLVQAFKIVVDSWKFRMLLL